MSNGARTALARQDFDVGDAVVSPHHGVGSVTGREVRAFERGRREYLTIELQRRGITLMVPLDNAARTGLRPLSSPTDARRALEALGGQAQPLANRWSQRRKEISARLGSGELLALAEVVRDLTHAANLRRPSTTDRELGEQAHALLEAELMAVLGDAAKADIARRLAVPFTPRP